MFLAGDGEDSGSFLLVVRVDNIFFPPNNLEIIFKYLLESSISNDSINKYQKVLLYICIGLSSCCRVDWISNSWIAIQTRTSLQISTREDKVRRSYNTWRCTDGTSRTGLIELILVWPMYEEGRPVSGAVNYSCFATILITSLLFWTISPVVSAISSSVSFPQTIPFKEDSILEKIQLDRLQCKPKATF